MAKMIPTYCLHGIEAIPIDVIVDDDRAKIVESKIGRIDYSVKLESTASVSSITAHIVNVQTSPIRKRAPARSITALICPVSPTPQDTKDMVPILLEIVV
jgi:hypothetical protein